MVVQKILFVSNILLAHSHSLPNNAFYEFMRLVLKADAKWLKFGY